MQKKNFSSGSSCVNGNEELLTFSFYAKRGFLQKKKRMEPSQRKSVATLCSYFYAFKWVQN